MTEAEWLSGNDPEPMLWFLAGKASDRKFRLFACGCIRRAWQLLVDPASRAAVEFSEKYADTGLRGRRGFPAIRRAARLAFRAAQEAMWRASPEDHPAGEAKMLAAYAVDGLTEPVQVGAIANNLARATRVLRIPRVAPENCPEQEQQARLLREHFGNPFRPVSFDPGWRTLAVVALATGIYEERAFDRMPILADALEDAGCDRGDLIGHLRDPHATHVRGCWALDLILGKE